VADVSEDDLVKSMVGRTVDDLYGKRDSSRGRVRLAVDGLTTADGQVRNVSFDVRAGEILGVAGLVGSGKSELGLALAGAIASSGTVTLNDKPVKLGTPAQAVSASIAYVPEDRKAKGLMLMRSVKHNLSLPWGQRIARFGLIMRGQERRFARSVATKFRIRSRSLDSRVEHLSGGNQQKIMLARWLALDPAVIVLGEPTRGIDVVTKSEVYRLIQQAAAAGAAVVMISSEILELLGVCDRILVMFRGRIAATLDAAAATEESVAAAAVGVASESRS
jgi:ABC-type sugar transport system ATPase subunit